jgi:uncharacterized membrane protein
MVAAGAGTFVLGLFTLLNELSTGVNKLLNAFDTGGVGPLSGKSILASIAFIVVLGALWALWRDKDVDLKKMFWIGIGLGVVGALLTFPPIFAAGH